MHMKVRCPVCGMLTYIRNLGKKHKLQMFKVELGGSYRKEKKGDKVKGKVTWTETGSIGENTIEEFWLSYLLDCSINLVEKGNLERDLDVILKNKILELAILVGLKKEIKINPKIPLQFSGEYETEIHPQIKLVPLVYDKTIIKIHPKIRMDIKQ